MSNKLKYYRGDSIKIELNFTDGSGDALDISEWSVFLTIKHDIDDTDDDAVVQKVVTSHSDPTHGKTLVNVPASEVNTLEGPYYYDIQVKKADGTIKTIISDMMIFLKDITRSIS